MAATQCIYACRHGEEDQSSIWMGKKGDWSGFERGEHGRWCQTGWWVFPNPLSYWEFHTGTTISGGLHRMVPKKRNMWQLCGEWCQGSEVRWGLTKSKRQTNKDKKWNSLTKNSNSKLVNLRISFSNRWVRRKVQKRAAEPHLFVSLHVSNIGAPTAVKQSTVWKTVSETKYVKQNIKHIIKCL